MTKLKMSREEFLAESKRMSVLIQKGSEAGLKAVKEMSKHPLSLEQMREQVRRQHADTDQVWKQGSRNKPESSVPMSQVK